MARFRDLPPEVLEEIMVWLPPESLKRFKLVHKSWRDLITALINDPVFVDKHLRNTKIKLLTSRHYTFKHIFSINIIDDDEEDKEDKEGEHKNQEDDEKEEEKGVEGEVKEEEEGEQKDKEDDNEEEEKVDCGCFLLTLAGEDCDGLDIIPCDTDDTRKLVTYLDNLEFKVAYHCNGIICIADLNEGIVFLMNPGLRELKTIRCSSYSNDYKVRAVGFGYDSRANDYKVVALITLPINIDVDGPFHAEVYALSTNSWKGIELDVEISNIKFEHQQVYCNGVYYWYYWDWVMLIKCFDFSDEVFRNVPMPKGIVEVHEWDDLVEWTKIGVWNESVVLFFYPDEGPKVIDMWVLNSKSGGVEGSYSWTKHLTIGPLEGIKWPLAFWNKEELFLESDKDDELKFYHLGYEIVSHISVYLDWLNSYRFLIYEESLVSVLGAGKRFFRD